MKKGHARFSFFWVLEISKKTVRNSLTLQTLYAIFSLFTDQNWHLWSQYWWEWWWRPGVGSSCFKTGPDAQGQASSWQEEEEDAWELELREECLYNWKVWLYKFSKYVKKWLALSTSIPSSARLDSSCRTCSRKRIKIISYVFLWTLYRLTICIISLASFFSYSLHFLPYFLRLVPLKT